MKIAMRMSLAVAVSLGSLAAMATGLPQWTSERTKVLDPTAAMLEVSSKGHMMVRRDEPAQVIADGAVTLVEPAKSNSEETKLEELTEECMHTEPTAECMEKFGSYGIRKLYTESWANVGSLGYRRPGWMSHPNVQKKKLFEVTLPGTANSGTYAINPDDPNFESEAINPYGIVSQNFDFYQQLDLGIRYFQIKVAYNAENSLVYVSHGTLMVPLATCLRDVRRFLEEHEREVVVLDISKDLKADASHLKALNDEEGDAARIPGQLVHEAVKCEMKEMLATYAALSQLPTTEQAENPRIGALTDIKAPVVYFYESQQVLCANHEECLRTPGWYPADKRLGGVQLPFGPPFALGTRVNATGSKETARIIEPMCRTRSGEYTKTDNPEILMKKLSEWSDDMPGKTQENGQRPACFAAGGKFPTIHKPTIWYTLDAFVTQTQQEHDVQLDRMRGVKAIYTRGEGYTVKTDAERTNYILLSWFLKKGNQRTFTSPNAILVEFAGAASMPIIRIIEAEQGRPECGWAVHCKESGSCWADTLLGPEDECWPEEIVMNRLKVHADGVTTDFSWIYYVTIAIVSAVVGACLLGVLRYLVKAFWGGKKASKKSAGAEKLAENTAEGKESSGETGDESAAAETDDDEGLMETTMTAAP
jgi:hypothetical protein